MRALALGVLSPTVSMFRSIAIAAALTVAAMPSRGGAEPTPVVLADAAPILEPAVDETASHLVRDGMWAMTVYQLRKIVDRDLAGGREAADVDALDEVADSTWFTNRHARRRLSPAALVRGPNVDGHAPAERGPLVVVAAKPKGMTEGFVVRDAKGDRYLLKFDPPGYPGVPTGAEMVCTKILHALGWNVPENFLVSIDPRRLTVAAGGEGHAAGLGEAEMQAILARVDHGADGRVRAVASRWLPGKAKGGFATLGRREDDPDDLVPHEDRRELRGLRVVAAWINYTDARRGNFFDGFVPDPQAGAGRGHLVHYVLDFSSALGAGNDDWKPPRYGHEYFFDPPTIALRAVTLGMAHRPWDDLPLVHPALGYFDADTFDPEAWRTTYPNPLFAAATVRDRFWGAKLVSTLTDADLHAIARTAAWSDARAESILVDLLRRRQRAIARAYFDVRRIDPIDGVHLEPVDGVRAGEAIDAVAAGRGGARARLGFHDLAVENGVAAAGTARYRHRTGEGAWVESASPSAVVALVPPATMIELETSHDGGTTWSPPARITVEQPSRGQWAVTAIARATR